MAIQDLLDKIPANKRTRVIQMVVGAFVIIVALIAYYASGQDEKHAKKKAEETRPITLGDKLMEDDIRAVLERDREEQREYNQAVSEKVKDMETTVRTMEEVLTSLKATKLEPDEKQKKTGEPLPEVEANFKYPPPVAGTAVAGNPQNGQPFDQTDPVFIGGIEHVEGEPIQEVSTGKKKRTFYLSPSFMEAMLLTGLKAETIEDAKDNPEPMVLRVQKPAILPNSIKADLQGCFVIAHGFGKLSSERVDARLVSMHCLAQNGRAVIDQEVKGFVVDSDGTKGLKGIPVTKMGANMARVFLAGIFGGIGQAARTSATVTSINPVGTVSTTPDGQSLMQAGIGQGVSDAAADIRKVYLDLVRQSAPVLEIGPTKKVTVVITEGVNLEIRGYTESNEGENRGKRS